MSDPNRGGGLGSIVMLLTLFIGGVALESQLNLQGSRPVLDSKIHHHHLDEEDVDARLWQDPFQAVDQSVKAHQKEHGHDSEFPTSRWLKFKKNLKLKKKPLKEKPGDPNKPDDPKESGKILVLGIMVSSGSYFVDSEDRIRTRYAVVSGLMSAGYRPATSEYIGYLEGKNWSHVHGKMSHHYAHHHMPFRVPYEWFERIDTNDENKQERLVLVLWLDDRHVFHEEEGEFRPLKNIQIFFRHLVAESLEEDSSKRKNLHPEGHKHLDVSAPMHLKADDFSKFRFVVIGPPTSGHLRRMVMEGTQDRMQGPMQNTPKIQILSTRATKDEQQILQSVLEESSGLEISKYLNGKSIFYPEPEPMGPEYYVGLVKGIEGKGRVFKRMPWDQTGISISEYFKEKNVHFLRTTPTDLELAQALVKELELRGVTRNSPIALVSEFDTDYGRAFRKTMCKVWVDEFPEEAEGDSEKEDSSTDNAKCKNIHYFGYLRGLDGQIPETTNNEGEQDAKKASPLALNLVPDDVATLRAEQPRQYDYLLRLAAKIKEIENGLESDGGLILPMFQNPRFEAFGILGSDYYDKLVVLQALRKKFTRAHFFTTDMDARLFHTKDYKYVRNLIVASGFGLRLRDDLQKPTPPFRDTYQTSAFLATRLALEPEAVLSQKHLDHWLEPRVLEIGRTRAFDLSDESPAEENEYPKIRFSTNTGFTDDVEPKHSSLHSQKPSLFSPYKYPNLIVLTAIFVGLLCWNFKDYWKKIVWTSVVLVGFVIFIVFLSGCLNEEPLVFFEGVSVWPTDFFRLIAIVVAVLFIQVFNQRFEENLDVMKDKFDHTEETRRIDWFPEDRKEFYWQVGWRTVAFVSVGFMVLLTFGLPFTPVRGDISPIIDKTILVFFIFAFGISLFYAGIKLNESIDLIEKFVPGKKGTWTDKTADVVFENLEIATTLKPVRPVLNDLISLRFIGLRTNVADELIYYPFGIIAIGILSRNRVFDNWDFPLALFSIFGFGALYILVKAFQVQHKAKKRKQEVLDRLQIQQIQFQAAGLRKEKELVESLVADTEDYKEGAFLPFVEHSFFKAMLLPFSGFGGMALLEYMFLAV